ncbi:MAG: MATE family efflux transporter [Bacteroidales bacterium]|nr:MATE family efflux transporter [Bacteroidales bacterium]
MNREILRISIPSIVTNITVPLLGMVDLAIVGHIGDAGYIAAIALATMVFNLIYWNFGFLRAGTTGLTAQAFGAEDKEEYLNVLVRGIAIALSAAVLLLLLQWPIALLCKRFIHSSPTTISLMLTYFYIRIWAAPATISLYVLKGWFLGMQNAASPMWIATILNLVNIVFSLLFVYAFDAGIAGVAWGSVVAQYSGLLLAVIIWIRRYGHLWHDIRWRAALQLRKMVRFFKVNADIFLRSLCLIAVFTFIPYISADMGEEILAANTLLMQLFTLTSYVMDGFAYAGESLVGKYVGARNSELLHKVVRLLVWWGVALAVFFTLLFFFGGEALLRVLAKDEEVIGTAMQFMFWTYLLPFTGFAAFIYDGIYIGATASAAMRNVMFVATAVFFALYYALVARWGNHALWFAFIFFLIFRGGLMILGERRYVFGSVEFSRQEINE